MPVALTLGITAAIWRGSWYDRVVGIVSVSVVSVPEFLRRDAGGADLRREAALAAGAVLCERRRARSAQLLRSFAMPIMTLSFVIMAQMVRMSRAALVTQLDSSYVEMARAQGRAPGPHRAAATPCPNALGPIVNAVALSLSSLLGGVIIVETIFNYPGLAKLMVDAVSTRDMPLVQACAMIFCAAYLTLVTVADIVAILSNPRLRHR